MTNLIEHAVSIGALEFPHKGITLKSGRCSPYFFNSGEFVSGEDLRVLAEAYVSAMSAEKFPKFDVVFGPAYKGIVLAAVVVSHLACQGVYKKYAHDRKEPKDHGEGGDLVGASLQGKRVLIVDDVITDGATKDAAVEFVKAHGGTPVGLLIAFDRQEKVGNSSHSAAQLFAKKHQIPVFSAVTAKDLIGYLACSETQLPEGQDRIEIGYRVAQYLVKYGA